MQQSTAVGLEKCNREQRTENGEQGTVNREKRTEKPITESPLITNGMEGGAGQQ